MSRLVECVPNFSEGRRPQTISKLVEEIRSVQSAVVLDVHTDADHNRSVITFVANPEEIVEAAVRVVAAAASLIDLRKHTGQHPRIGATDVLPFVPLDGTTMNKCVGLAHQAGTRIAYELGIPVYFYGQAALRAERVNLEDVRRGGFEGLSEQLRKTPSERAPDAGDLHLHESAGATIIGVRQFLIAYNINLETTDVRIAQRIARTVRERNGGLRYLKAIGVELHQRRLVQVSMNLVNYEETGLHQAYEAVRREAKRYGVKIVESEIVGLAPRAAINQSAEYFERHGIQHPAPILEDHLASIKDNPLPSA